MDRMTGEEQRSRHEPSADELMPGLLGTPPATTHPNRAPQWDPQGQAAWLQLPPSIASLVTRLVHFPYSDPSQAMCDCGCGIHVAVNTLIADLCGALFEASAWDYRRYKRLFDATAHLVDRSARVPYLPRNGLLALARQTGVSHYAWAIMDPKAAQQTLEVIGAVARAHGVPFPQYLISIGAGNGYVESVFARQAQIGGYHLQVIAYDTFPSATPFLPIYPGTPLNILTDFPTAENCALLLCWPPLGTSLADGSYNPTADPSRPTNTMASDSLRNFELKGGRFVIYIGERTTFGCTGDPAFHSILAEGRWRLMNEDARGNSTVQMDKWCPQPSAIPTDYSSADYQIGGVSGNDNVWVYFLPPDVPSA